jgi:C-terminal processing protease CtpA/Prc
VAPPDSTRKVLFRTKRGEQQFYFHPQYPDVGVLQIKEFHGRGNRVYRKAFREMHRRHTTSLVIDVRNNLGGSFSGSMNVARYVADESFQVRLSRPVWRTWRHQPLKTTLGRVGAIFKFDLLNLSPRWVRHGRFYYRLKFRPRHRHHFDGQVVVLTNGWSFSASSLMATYVQTKCHRATVVGEETGGGARSNNGMQIPKFVLPASHIRLRIPQYNLDYRLGPDEGRGVLPDVPVHYGPAEVLAGRDLAWEAALQVLKKSPIRPH